MAHFGKGHALDCEKKIKKRGLEKSEPVQNLLGNSRSRFNSTEWFLKKLERRINR